MHWVSLQPKSKTPPTAAACQKHSAPGPSPSMPIFGIEGLPPIGPVMIDVNWDISLPVFPFLNILQSQSGRVQKWENVLWCLSGSVSCPPQVFLSPNKRYMEVTYKSRDFLGHHFLAGHCNSYQDKEEYLLSRRQFELQVSSSTNN